MGSDRWIDGVDCVAARCGIKAGGLGRLVVDARREVVLLDWGGGRVMSETRRHLKGGKDHEIQPREELLHEVKGSVVLSVLTGLFLTGFVILGEGTVSFQHAAAAAGGYGALFTWFYVSGRRAREVRPAPWRVRSAMLPDARLLLLLGPLIIAGWELDGVLREAVPALLVSGAWLGAMADGWVLGLFAGGGCTLGGALRVLCADISNDWRER